MTDISKYVKAKKEAGRIAGIKVKQNNAELQCECTHTEKGGPALEFNKKTHVCECKICGKAVNLNPISIEDQNKAVTVIDDMCDLIKMRINPNNKKEMDLYKKIKKLQLRVTTSLRDYYQAARSNNKKNGNKKKNNNNHSDFGRTVTK